MSHHSGPDKETLGALASLFKDQDTTDHLRDFRESLGATQKFPEGTLGDDDEGEIRIGITHTDGKVVLAFGKAIDWIGFPPEQARNLAQSFLDHAQECDGVEARVRLIATES